MSKSAKPGRARAHASESKHSAFAENALTIGWAIGIAMVIRIFLFELFLIEGPSMEPTLYDADRVVVAKWYGIRLPFTYDAIVQWSTPDLGDVVIVTSPYDDVDIIKRVVGVEGDRVAIRDGVVYRNGKPLTSDKAGTCTDDKDRAYQEPTCVRKQEKLGDHVYEVSHSSYFSYSPMEERVVPEDHIFIMGDHRDRSNDSRNFGFVPHSRIKGTALAIYYSGSWPNVRWSRIFSGVD